MEIRRAAEGDLGRILEIYAYARAFMAAHGNPLQWGPTRWPPEALIRRDIAGGHSYVCTHGGSVAGVFFFAAGADIEPAYRHIEGGRWLDSGPYGVVHRLAGGGQVRGIGALCLDWAYRQCGHLRVDTHPDNRIMRGLLDKLGFTRCGVIHVAEDGLPRLAYEKTGAKRAGALTAGASPLSGAWPDGTGSRQGRTPPR